MSLRRVWGLRRGFCRSACVEGPLGGTQACSGQAVVYRGAVHGPGCGLVQTLKRRGFDQALGEEASANGAGASRAGEAMKGCGCCSAVVRIAACVGVGVMVSSRCSTGPSRCYWPEPGRRVGRGHALTIRSARV